MVVMCLGRSIQQLHYMQCGHEGWRNECCLFSDICMYCTVSSVRSVHEYLLFIIPAAELQQARRCLGRGGGIAFPPGLDSWGRCRVDPLAINSTRATAPPMQLYCSVLSSAHAQRLAAVCLKERIAGTMSVKIRFVEVTEYSIENLFRNKRRHHI